MKKGHEYEVLEIRCECGYEGAPDYHEHWVWNRDNPVQGPITLAQHRHAETIQTLGETVRAIYEPMVREQLKSIPPFRTEDW